MNKKKNNTMPFANEVKKAKDDFKQMIDKMDDDTFLTMMFLIDSTINEQFDEDCDGNCENCDMCEEDFESPFSGEMINFKCVNCGKILALPIEIVNDMYEETQEPHDECFNCKGKMSPMYYKTPDGKIFKI